MATRYNYTGGIVTNGLVLNLDAAKTDSYPGSSTTWRDLSGFGNNGTLINGPTFSGIGKQASIVFDGVNDNVNMGDIIYNSSSATTIDLWLNIETFVDNDAVITKGAQGLGNDTTFAAWIIPTTTVIRNRFYNSTNTGSFVNSNTLNTNTWYNMVWTYNGSLISLYQNSTFIQSSSLTGTLKNCTYPLLIGSGFTGGNFTNMKSSSLKIYNRALTQQEITQNFNALRGRYNI